MNVALVVTSIQSKLWSSGPWLLSLLVDKSFRLSSTLFVVINDKSFLFNLNYFPNSVNGFYNSTIPTDDRPLPLFRSTFPASRNI
jgi:hypothetical protein